MLVSLATVIFVVTKVLTPPPPHYRSRFSFNSDSDAVLHLSSVSISSTSADYFSLDDAISRLKFTVSRQYQHFFDKTMPHMLRCWIGSLIIACIYVLRIYLIQDFYIVSYGLGIYMLNLLIGFLFPQVDFEIQEATLSTGDSDEFRPFVRRLPEFKF
nr:protein RER1B-like [Arachis hypogaea]